MGFWGELAAAAVVSVAEAIKEQNGGSAARPRIGAGQGGNRQNPLNFNRQNPPNFHDYSVVVTDGGVLFPHVTYDDDEKSFFAKWVSMVELEVVDSEKGPGLCGTLRGGIGFCASMKDCLIKSSHRMSFLSARARKSMDDDAFRQNMQSWQTCASEGGDAASNVFRDWMQGFLNSVRVSRVFMASEENNQNLFVFYTPVLERMQMVAANIGDKLKHARSAIDARVLDQYTSDVPLYYRWLGVPMLEMLDEMIEDFLPDCLSRCSDDEERNRLEAIRKDVKIRQKLVGQIRALDPSIGRSEKMFADLVLQFS